MARALRSPSPRTFLAVVALVGAGWVVMGQTQAPQLPAPSVDRVGFPEGWENWKVLFTFDRPDSKQVRVILGNEFASFAKPGRPFPHGSVLVMATYRAKQDAAGNVILDANGRYQKDVLGGLFVQRKERGFGVEYQQYRSGDWEYAAYRADKTPLRKPTETGACAQCHLEQAGASRDYVFRAELWHSQASGAVPDGVMTHYAYLPKAITVKSGQTVTWYNDDEAIHTITATDSSHGAIDSGSILEGGSWSRTFVDPGTYSFACKVHPAMKLTVTVEK